MSELRTEPRLAAIEEELRRREPIFHKPELGTTRADYEGQTAEDFWEVGASGRIYSRAFVLDVLVERGKVPGDEHWVSSGFHCRELGPDTYALTYTLLQGERLTRRLTIWRRVDGDWKILYHQGTVVADATAVT